MTDTDLLGPGSGDEVRRDALDAMSREAHEHSPGGEGFAAEPDDREARACLTQATRYAEGMALTERARGRGDDERAWLDMLALLERVALFESGENRG